LPTLNSDMEKDEAGVFGIQQLWLTQNGLKGTAEVFSIAARGIEYNLDPLITLTLKIQPAMIAVAFETTGKIILSRAEGLQVGDKIKVKYYPANPMQFIVFQKNGL
jgi:hypothetical protein